MKETGRKDKSTVTKTTEGQGNDQEVGVIHGQFHLMIERVTGMKESTTMVHQGTLYGQ